MCIKCELNPVYEFTNKRKLCKTCFIHWFQKKVLYSIRKYQMLGQDDIVAYEKKDSPRGVVLEDILKMVADSGRISLVSLPKKKFDKIATAETIDLTANEIIRVTIKNKLAQSKKIQPVYKKQIKPLYFFLDKEVELYAQLKRLNYKKEKKKENFLDLLEKNHPEVKRAVVMSYLKLVE